MIVVCSGCLLYLRMLGLSNEFLGDYEVRLARVVMQVANWLVQSLHKAAISLASPHF